MVKFFIGYIYMSQNYSRLLSQGDASSTTSMVKGAIIRKIVGILVLVSLVVLLGWLAKKAIEKYFPQLTPNSKSVGDDCLESFECIGYKVGDGPACCLDPKTGKKSCTLKVKDTFGAWWCPNEAKTTGGTKTVGQECNESSECAGYTFGSGVSGTACCLDKIDNKKKCVDKVKDNAGSWWCPSEAIRKAGTVPVDELCNESSECAGYVFGKGQGNISCCKNKCTPLVKDLAGNWYCPSEATGQRGLGSPCTDSYQCAGYKAGSGPACCGPFGKKTCTNKKLDWAGNWYCPEECVGAFAGKPGTCK